MEKRKRSWRTCVQAIVPLMLVALLAACAGGEVGQSVPPVRGRWRGQVFRINPYRRRESGSGDVSWATR